MHSFLIYTAQVLAIAAIGFLLDVLILKSMRNRALENKCRMELERISEVFCGVKVDGKKVTHADVYTKLESQVEVFDRLADDLKDRLTALDSANQTMLVVNVRLQERYVEAQEQVEKWRDYFRDMGAASTHGPIYYTVPARFFTEPYRTAIASNNKG